MMDVDTAHLRHICDSLLLAPLRDVARAAALYSDPGDKWRDNAVYEARIQYGTPIPAVDPATSTLYELFIYAESHRVRSTQVDDLLAVDHRHKAQWAFTACTFKAMGVVVPSPARYFIAGGADGL